MRWKGMGMRRWKKEEEGEGDKYTNVWYTRETDRNKHGWNAVTHRQTDGKGIFGKFTRSPLAISYTESERIYTTYNNIYHICDVLAVVAWGEVRYVCNEILSWNFPFPHHPYSIQVRWLEGNKCVVVYVNQSTCQPPNHSLNKPATVTHMNNHVIFTTLSSGHHHTNRALNCDYIHIHIQDPCTVYLRVYGSVKKALPQFVIILVLLWWWISSCVRHIYTSHTVIGKQQEGRRRNIDIIIIIIFIIVVWCGWLLHAL